MINKIHLEPPLQIEDVETLTIGDNVLIGSHVFIKQGVNVGPRAIIGAGSIVLNDIELDWIVGGNPARFLKMRE